MVAVPLLAHHWNLSVEQPILSQSAQHKAILFLLVLPQLLETLQHRMVSVVTLAVQLHRVIMVLLLVVVVVLVPLQHHVSVVLV
jgi:hypothetical protein